MTKFAIDVHNLEKYFGQKKVLNGLSLSVKEGCVYGFLGPNGSGKTTTMRIICGLLTPDGGSGMCLGFDIIKDSYDIKRHIGYMPQRFSLYEELTVRENLTLIANIYQPDNPTKCIKDTVEWLGLGDWQHQQAGTLSGGWKQRLSLAGAILHKPKLLLLDEPTAGVDPMARRLFWNYIFDLAKQGVTVLVSTHYMDEASRCNEIAYLFYGNVLMNGTSQQIIEDSNLFSYAIHPPYPDDIEVALKSNPSYEQIAHFGNTIHVIGKNKRDMEAHLKTLKKSLGITYMEMDPDLEDIFVHVTQEWGSRKS